MTQLGRRSSVKETKKKKRLRLPQGRGDAENEGATLFLSFFVVVAFFAFFRGVGGGACVYVYGGRGAKGLSGNPHPHLFITIVWCKHKSTIYAFSDSPLREKNKIKMKTSVRDVATEYEPSGIARTEDSRTSEPLATVVKKVLSGDVGLFGSKNLHKTNHDTANQ